MKKLMTMIAAAAMAFGLYADDTLNNSVDFADYGDVNPWTLTGSDGQTKDTLWAWAGAATDPATDEAKIESKELVLSTGSNVLSRKFAADATAIDKGLFVDMVLDYNGEALDAIPTVESGKIAIFALDQSEIEGIPEELKAQTNVYVLANYGEDGKALYRIKTFDFDTPRRVALKAYENVITGDADARAGFLVYMGAETAQLDKLTPAVATAVYAFDENDQVVWTDVKGEEPNYLGRSDVMSSKWVKGKNLFISLDADPQTSAKLASVDFVGRAKLASITLTDDSTDWPADDVRMAVELTDAEITDITGAELMGEELVAEDNGVEVTFKAAPKGKDNVTVDYTGVISGPAEDGVYTITFNENNTLTVKGWDTAATVGTEKFESLFGDNGAIAYVNENGGTLKLAKPVEAKESLAFEGANEIVLDLNGKAITFDGDAEYAETISNNGGVLTIIDSDDGGSVAAGTGTYAVSVGNYGTLTIEDGIFLGGIYNEETLTITGGKFDVAIDNDASATIVTTGGAFKDPVFAQDAIPGVDYTTYEAVAGTEDLLGYWVVQVAAPKTGFMVILANGTEVGPYDTLAGALENAAAGATIKLLSPATESAAAVITTANITFDLNGNALTFTECDGLHFEADGGVVSNGTVIANATGKNWLAPVYFTGANGLVKDVEVQANGTKYGVVTDTANNEYLDKTVVCENVTVTGSGLLFYCEAQNMTLTDCSAVQTGTSAWGSDYSDAVGAGCLGQLTVNSGTYTAEANAVGTMTSPADIILEGGTFTGPLHYIPVTPAYLEEFGRDHAVSKAAAVELTAPAGYFWEKNGDYDVLKLIVATVNDTQFSTAAAALTAVQALEAAGTYPITVTACIDNLEVTNPATSETITLAKNAVIAIDDKGGWTFTGGVTGEVTLDPGKSITVPEGSELKVIAPEGYKVVTDTSVTGFVTYTVVELPDVAQIGDQKFKTMADAFGALTDDVNETITLLDNTSTPKVQVKKSFTLNLNGKTFTTTEFSVGVSQSPVGIKDCVISNGTIACAANQTYLVRLYGNSLTLKDVELDATGMIAPTEAGRDNYTGAILATSGSVYLQGTTTIKNVATGLHAVSFDLYAGATNYKLGTFDFANGEDANVSIGGDVLIAGGTVVNADKATFTGTKFIVAAGNGDFCTPATLANSGLEAIVGEYPTEKTTGSYLVNKTAEAYLSLADAAAAAEAEEKVQVCADVTCDAATFTAAAQLIVGTKKVEVTSLTLAGTKIELAKGGEFTNAAVTEADFVAPAEGQKLVNNEGTWTVVDIVYATLTVVKGDENVTAVVVSNATEEVALDDQGQAKFDKDAAVEITVYPTFADGYELDTEKSSALKATMADDATIEVFSKETQSGVVPEQPQPIDAANLDEAKEKAAKMPVQLSAEAAAAAGAGADALKDKLYVSAEQVGPSSFQTKVEFKPEAVAEVTATATAVETALATQNADLAAEEVTVTVTEGVIPGLYYGIVAVDDLGEISTTEPEDWKLATKAGVTLTAEKPSPTKGFYRVKCAPDHPGQLK